MNVTPQYCHLFARGVDKRNIFISPNDYAHFILAMALSLRPKAPSMSVFKDYVKMKLISARSITFNALNRKYKNPQVKIHTFVCMPNHFHIQASYSDTRSLSKFLQRLVGSYTKYFNTKYKREGRLFSSRVKRVQVTSDEQNLYLSKYIHTNPVDLRKISIHQLALYPWSSYPQYIQKHDNFYLYDRLAINTQIVCTTDTILSYVQNNKYQSFIENAAKNPKINLPTKILLDY